MRLGGEMDDPLDSLVEAADDLAVADVAADKLVTGVALDVPEVIEVPRIGELVEVDEPDRRIFLKEIMNKVAADEPGPTGNEKRPAFKRP